ncbi:MAG: putative DNA-directed polymerase (epsilon subunit) [Bacteroidetes bacterium]|nr:putative DNA-directed polymerase (epsilon subunit) [Bacteroidota bacterium]
MFAIIDIETCGGKFEFQNGRITEICILVHDGLQVVDKFTTLINPDCNISPYFTKLTNITNEMVADAPRFHEVAKKIIEMTEGRIFVAHNVGFDYGFIKAEFASLGYKYRRDTLCTVRLSRKLMPGRISYSLGHLCASLGIEIFGRHRAEGDAVATAQLFDLLIQLKTQHPQYKNMGVEEIMSRRIDKIKEYILKKLPEACGVYYFLNKNQEIIYIGKSTNIYQRAIGHFNTTEKKGKKMLNDLYNVDFVLTGSELIALLLEADEIKKHKPKYNRMRKSEVFTHCIDWFTDKTGIINFKIVEYDQSESALLSFNSYSSAREKLERLLEEQVLCLKYCNLTSEDSVCFNHQIKTCNGICAGEEEAEEYNKRAQKVLDEYIFKTKDFVLLDRGRQPEEYSIIHIENGKYRGYGYLDSTHQVACEEELKYVASPKTYYPDCDNLVRGWMKNASKYKVIKIK